MAQGRLTRTQWWHLVEGFSDSGLMQARYCERHGISVASFHRWRTHFRQAAVADSERAEAIWWQLTDVGEMLPHHPGAAHGIARHRRQPGASLRGRPHSAGWRDGRAGEARNRGGRSAFVVNTTNQSVGRDAHERFIRCFDT